MPEVEGNVLFKVVYPRRGYFMIIQKGVIKLEEEIASNLKLGIVEQYSKARDLPIDEQGRVQ